MAEKTCSVVGRKGAKPAQKRYVTSRRSERNALLRAERHARRLAKFQRRRAAKKRNAYLEGRGGRPHPKRKRAAEAA